MTIEEKAKAYDEALEKAKIEISTKGIGETVNLCYQLFPQLAKSDDEESDDERIRKRLIEYFEGFRMGNAEVRWEGLIVQEVLAWLEKQKESLPISEICKENANSFIDGIIEVRSFQRGMEEGRRLEKQKENPKSADSIPSDCTAGAKCEDRWHKVEDSLPDNPREVLCKDEARNYFIGRYYAGEGWEISNYDDEDKPHHLNPPVSKWIDFPSEKQKEQKPVPFSCGHEKGAKWSEEDEAAYNAFICEVVNEKMNPTIEQVKWLRSIRDRLKSLPLSCPKKSDNWKPSEEQMKALTEEETPVEKERRRLKGDLKEEVCASDVCAYRGKNVCTVKRDEFCPMFKAKEEK